MKTANDLSPDGMVTSADGTPLAYTRIGAGLPLVVCHGSFADASEWREFAEIMAATNTVYLYDRRGHDSNPEVISNPALDAEIDDLAAIVQVAGPEAAVLGHSFGGGCALGHAVRDSFAGTLVLYEPRHSILGPISRGYGDELRRLVASGSPEEAAEYAMRQIIGMPAEAFAAFRGSPPWKTVVDMIGQFPNELRLLDSLAWQPGDLDGIAGPVWLLTGETSKPSSPDLSPDEALRGRMAGIRSVTIPGQGHFAYRFAPALLADIVRDCLGSSAA